MVDEGYKLLIWMTYADPGIDSVAIRLLRQVLINVPKMAYA